MSQCTWLLVDTFCVTEDRYFLKVHLKSGESYASGEYKKIATCFGCLLRNFPEFLGLFWQVLRHVLRVYTNPNGKISAAGSHVTLSGLCSLQPRKMGRQKKAKDNPVLYSNKTNSCREWS